MWPAVHPKTEKRLEDTMPVVRRWSLDAGLEREFEAQEPSCAVIEFEEDIIASLRRSSSVTILPARPPGDIVYVSSGTGKGQIVTYIELKWSQPRSGPWHLMQIDKPNIVPTGSWASDFRAALVQQEQVERGAVWHWSLAKLPDTLGPTRLGVVTEAEVDAAVEGVLTEQQWAATGLLRIKEWLRRLTFEPEVDVHVAEAIPEHVRPFIDLVREVPAVQHVALMEDGDVSVLWSITDRYDMSAYDEIYSRELALCDEWPDVFYDFHVLPLEGRSVEAVLPHGFQIVWSRSM